MIIILVFKICELYKPFALTTGVFTLVVMCVTHIKLTKPDIDLVDTTDPPWVVS